MRTLNVGYNNLTDSAIGDMTDGLRATRTLQGLGLQATVLTCKGAALLAEAITQNKSLEVFAHLFAFDTLVLILELILIFRKSTLKGTKRFT